MALDQSIDCVKRDHQRGDQHAIFEQDVVEPVAGERGFRLRHCDCSLATSCFSMVVLASHSPPSWTVLRCCGTKPRCLKKSCPLSLTSAIRRRAPRPAASFSRASLSSEPTPFP